MNDNKQIYCIFCGKSIPSNAKFCPFCGKEVFEIHQDSSSIITPQCTDTHEDCITSNDAGTDNVELPTNCSDANLENETTDNQNQNSKIFISILSIAFILMISIAAALSCYPDEASTPTANENNREEKYLNSGWRFEGSVGFLEWPTVMSLGEDSYVGTNRENIGDNSYITHYVNQKRKEVFYFYNQDLIDMRNWNRSDCSWVEVFDYAPNGTLSSSNTYLA